MKTYNERRKALRKAKILERMRRISFALGLGGLTYKCLKKEIALSWAYGLGMRYNCNDNGSAFYEFSLTKEMALA